MTHAERTGESERVVDAHEVVAAVRKVAMIKEYRDSAVLATLKVLDATGSLLPAG